MDCAYQCGRPAATKFGLCASCQAQLSADANEALADLNHPGSKAEDQATRQLGAVRAVQLLREQSQLMDYVIAHCEPKPQPQPAAPSSTTLAGMIEGEQ